MCDMHTTPQRTHVETHGAVTAPDAAARLGLRTDRRDLACVSEGRYSPNSQCNEVAVLRK